MRVKYQVEQEDYEAFNLNHVSTSKMVERQRQLGMWIPPAVILFLAILLGLSREAWWATIPLGLLAALYVLSHPWQFRRTLARRLKKYLDEHSMVGLEGLCELVLEEETVTEINECWRYEIKWRYVHKIVETDTHTFIYQTALSAIIIPKRFFLSDNEYRKVVDYAKERLAACKAMV